MENIIRIEKNKNYSVISNIPFLDKILSWEAKGMMAYLLTKPDDWTIRFNDLVSQTDCGPDKVRKILKELQTSGYMIRNKVKDDKGKFVWHTIIFEDPSICRLSIYGLPIDGLSIYGKPAYILSTELTNTDSPNTDIKDSTASKTEADAPKKSNSKEVFNFAAKLSDICKMDMQITPVKGRLLRRAKELISAGYNENDLDIFIEYWKREDWRGRKGSIPTPELICTEIGKLKPSAPQADKIERDKAAAYEEITKAMERNVNQPARS
jgi:hypothetical protein